MKKSLIALAALAAVSATSAFAQATISGQAQVGVYRPIDSAANTTIAELSGSRTYIVFQDVEDLGGGLKAGVMAQARFDPTTSRTRYTFAGGDSLFEQSKIWLAGSFGTISLGKFNTQLGFRQGEVGAFGSDSALNARMPSTDSRNPAQMSYLSPNFSGFEFEVVVAAKNTSITGANTSTVNAAGTGGQDYSGANQGAQTQNLSQFSLVYKKGPLMGFYSYTDNNWGNKNSQYGGYYDFGVVKLMLSQQANQATNYAVSEPSRTYTSVGLQAPVGASAAVGFQYVRNNVTDETRTYLGAEYYLSKRTKVLAEIANNSNNPFSAAKNGTGSYLGLSHSF